MQIDRSAVELGLIRNPLKGEPLEILLPQLVAAMGEGFGLLDLLGYLLTRRTSGSRITVGSQSSAAFVQISSINIVTRSVIPANVRSKTVGSWSARLSINPP